MNINSIVNQINNAFNSSTTQVGQSVPDSLENGLNSLLNKDSGSFVSGKIVGMEGNEIILSLGEEGMVKASVEGNINSKIGDILTFSLKGGQNGKITLSPMFENTAMSTTANKALQAAGLPETPQNQYMVKSMMQEGISIDKQSLYDMSKAMTLNSTADVLDLAKMTRLNIPLNEDMVKQFESYQNFEHEITGALSDVADSFFESVVELIDSGESNEAVNMLKLFGDKMIDTSLGGSNEVVDANANDSVSNFSTKLVLDVLNLFDENENGVEAADGKVNDQATVDEVKVSIKDNELINSDKNTVNQNTSDKSIVNQNDIKDNSIISNQETNGNVNNKLSLEDGLKELINKLKTVDEKSLQDNPEWSKDLSKGLKELLSDNGVKESFSKALINKFLLNPEEVAEDGKVSKLYEKMNSQIKDLLNTVASQGKMDTSFGQTINNINSNLEFMNELNQTFNYVQIPLKMMNQEATGELYVYTNKKSLSRDDGNVSALLHLDMDNLGPVDVHVQMSSDNNVKTKFYLKDDASLDLIADNIDLLNSRIEKRGYKMSADFINKSDDKTVMDTILEDNKNISLISSASFDARA